MREENKDRGKQNREWGKETEELAYEYFLKNGYTIRERNWRCNKIEIDLILQLDNTIIFVEVKARKEGTQDPVDAVNRKKQLMMIRGADIYLRMLDKPHEFRFDIVTFKGDRKEFEFRHYPDAFMPSVNGGR
ncbi:MAG: YraN family protein [Candidatus Amulumruptor caecigallinarius]|nr:YraN family protein [Candidatus Amulumruptor caecigallinarius]